MEDVVEFLVAVDALEYDGKQTCVERMDALVQELIKRLTPDGYQTSGDLLELKNCSWVLHERYFVDDEQKFKWTSRKTTKWLSFLF